jgi:tetratricopeptide (TPR) repeat protein
MKRIFFTTLFAVLVTGLFAQKVDKAKDLLKANKLMEARTEIDNFLAQEKNQKNGEAWYTKAKIYNAISMNGSMASQVPNARKEAFQALKKYTEVDDKMLIALQIDGYKPVNDIYTAYYQEGANNFNSKKYEEAFNGFTNAIEVSQFMTQKGWINLKLDTNSVLYAGVAAEKMSKFDDAVKYYGQLAENKIKGEGFVEIYKWVANHYYEKKDMANAQKFIALGKEVYPTDPFWGSLELDMAREGGNKDDLFAKYEQTIAANPDNHLYRYNYAVELYQQGYNTDMTKRPANSADLIKKAQEQVNQSIRIKPDYSRAQLFAGQIAYNQGVDLLNAAKMITGTKPDEVKKKADTKAEAIKKFDEAAPYFLEVERLLVAKATAEAKDGKAKLKMEDKSDLKEAYDLLITIYDQKGNMKDKVKEYEVKFNEVDKKY